jgi:hypothetical protein
MTTSTDKARAKAARMAASATKRPTTTTDSPDADTAPAPVVSTATAAEDTTPVRTTIDLSPPLFDSFDGWVRSTTRKHRYGRSIKADVIRILIRRLLNDPELQRHVIDTLTQERKK